MADLPARLVEALKDRYTLQRELGRGGMATVYLAEDLKHHRQVAVKVLNAELAAVLGNERFLREIETSAKLNHPHILPLLDSGAASGVLFYTMPYAEGESLRDRLNREKQLPIEHALQIAREVADALAYAHRRNVVHRDIKPENILLEEHHAVVADFGIARAISAAGGEKLTVTGVALGTPEYMSPEQASGQGQLDGRSDIYALGCVLYEMLAGHPPFMGPTIESIVQQHLTARPPSVRTLRPTAPDWVATALERSLAKTAADRFDDAAQFGEAIAPRVSSAAPDARQRVPRRFIAAGAVAAALVVAGLVAWRYRAAMAVRGPPPPDRPYTVLAAVEGSADSAMRGTVEFLLRNGLDLAYVVQTVPRTEVERLLALMGRPAATVVGPATARELAQRYGVSTVVLARVDAVGHGYLVTARVEDAIGGHLRAEATHQAADAEAVVGAVEGLTRELRRDLGESRAALANADHLPEVMTPSIEALRKYQEGVNLWVRGSDAEAVRALEEAVALDSAFAMAWARLWAVYATIGDTDASRGAVRRALQYPDRLTEERRTDLRAQLLWDTDAGQWDNALAIRRRGNQTNYALMLAAFGFLDSALEIEKRIRIQSVRATKALDRTRTIEVCWENPWAYATATGRLPEWIEFLDSLQVVTPPACAREFEVWARLAAGDWAGSDSILRVAPDVWPWQRAMDTYTRQLDAVRGRVSAAHLAFAVSQESNEYGPAQLPALILEVVYGVPGRDSVVALASRGWRPVLRYVSHGARAALVGDTSEAKHVLQRLRIMRDSASSRRFEHAFGPLLAVIEAGPAARRGDWHRVIELLEPWDGRLRQPGYGYLGGDTYLIWWVLAQAYAQSGMPDSAITHLRSVVGSPRYRFIDFTIYGLPYSAAHFKLGQLYAQIGDTAKSLEHFSTFLDTFTDPDREYMWMVTEARAAAERLRRER